MTVFCNPVLRACRLFALPALLAQLTCAPAQAADPAPVPEQTPTERQVRKRADEYIRTVEDRNVEAWRELLTPLNPDAAVLNKETFLEQMRPIKSLSVKQISGLNVLLQIRFTSGPPATGTLQLDPEGRIKYTPLCFRHPLYAVCAQLERLLYDEVTLLGATSNPASRAEAVYELSAMGIPLFDYDPIAPSRPARRQAAGKILQWLVENGPHYDIGRPEILLPPDEFEALIERLRRVAQ